MERTKEIAYRMSSCLVVRLSLIVAQGLPGCQIENMVEQLTYCDEDFSVPFVSFLDRLCLLSSSVQSLDRLGRGGHDFLYFIFFVSVIALGFCCCCRVFRLSAWFLHSRTQSL